MGRGKDEPGDWDSLCLFEEGLCVQVLTNSPRACSDLVLKVLQSPVHIFQWPLPDLVSCVLEVFARLPLVVPKCINTARLLGGHTFTVMYILWQETGAVSYFIPLGAEGALPWAVKVQGAPWPRAGTQQFCWPGSKGFMV